MLGLIIFIVVAVIVSFLGWVVTRLKKGRMQGALGREVRDHEVNSISSWIAVADAEDKKKQQS